MSTRSASPFSVLRAIDEETQNRFFGGGLNGRCSRCHDLGIHSVSSRWKSVDGERNRLAPTYDGSMDSDIATIMKRLIRDKDYPLVDICWCCNFVDLWGHGLGLCQPAFKRRTVTRFGVADPLDLAESNTSGREASGVTMLNVPTHPFPVARRAGLRPDYQRIRNWLKICSSSHTACRPEWSESLRKIRVIDVKHRSIVYLPLDSSYLALSYVWGSSNQPSFPVGSVNLPFRLLRKLPKTIEDAVRVTRRLGFAYLWVDSVCIDQSNPEDKASQIGIMDRIYRGAHATIIALGSSSADTGLHRVRYRRAQERQMPVYHEGSIRYLSFLPTLREELDQSTWMKRGWTYQEGILSQRCIFFGRNQVFFTCNTMSTSEDGSESDDRSGRPRKYNPRLIETYYEPRGLINPFKVSGARQGMEQSTAFNSMIREYADRKFTNEGDALDAVAGVFGLLKETILPKGFLFGLPLDLFRSALLWTQTSTGFLRRRAIDKFPSWSWASWHLESPISIKNAVVDHCSRTQPPLLIRHLGKWIDCGSKDASTLRQRKRDVKMMGRLQALYQSTNKSPSEEDDTTLPEVHQGFLYVEGILLRLPYSQIRLPSGASNKYQEPFLQFGYPSPDINRRDQSFSMSQEALLKPIDNNEKYDFLFISAIPIVEIRLVWLQLLVLKWTNGIAQRIGVAKILFTEDELVKLWPVCDARHRVFGSGDCSEEQGETFLNPVRAFLLV
ncbi:HET-domain-containing protein [Karstenula rhodostoma CBS 690.94]|uniref:HET-domain-containing protein n=1 Tax=Karstenula rhodostoma CBS 690.94 TaxID=1392251 RepID=A0A9P4UAK6_9PLEO|nr:HET-domain-containing protein [Karstenula rhodostoma CBS 690.94]